MPSNFEQRRYIVRESDETKQYTICGCDRDYKLFKRPSQLSSVKDKVNQVWNRSSQQILRFTRNPNLK